MSPVYIDVLARLAALADIWRYSPDVWERAGMRRGLWVPALVIVVGAGLAYWLLDRQKLTRAISAQPAVTP